MVVVCQEKTQAAWMARNQQDDDYDAEVIQIFQRKTADLATMDTAAAVDTSTGIAATAFADLARSIKVEKDMLPPLDIKTMGKDDVDKMAALAMVYKLSEEQFMFTPFAMSYQTLGAKVSTIRTMVGLNVWERFYGKRVIVESDPVPQQMHGFILKQLKTTSEKWDENEVLKKEAKAIFELARKNADQRVSADPYLPY